MVVVPTGYRLPAGIPDRVMVTPGQLSLALAFPRAVSSMTFPHVVALAAVDMLRFAGALIVGSSLSATVTLKVQLVEPALFVAVAVTVVVPMGKVLPEG